MKKIFSITRRFYNTIEKTNVSPSSSSNITTPLQFNLPLNNEEILKNYFSNLNVIISLFEKNNQVLQDINKNIQKIDILMSKNYEDVKRTTSEILSEILAKS
jgi:hypothetical protein